MNITRRKALTGIGTLAAIAAPGAAFAAVQSPTAERPIDRVHRLAEELSDAIAAWEAEIAAVGASNRIECVIHAARRDSVRPIMFRPIRSVQS